jgi:DNA-binding transcriptional LysR family regulator
MLEIRRLRLLHALAGHGTVTAAAEKLHLSGPAVSQQLARLERETGIQLVERDGRRLKLTDAGRVLVAHTEIVLGQLAVAEADLVALRTEISGTVRLAAFPTAAATVVPEMWARLHTERGHRLQLQLIEMESEHSIPALQRAEIDIAVAQAYDDLLPRPLPTECERHDIREDPILVADRDPAGDEAQDTAADLSSLAGRPWILPIPSTFCHEMVQRACGAAGFVPRPVAHCNDFASMLALVAAGAGVALVPQLATRSRPRGVTLRRPCQRIVRTIFAVTARRGDRHPAVRVVLDELTLGSPDRQDGVIND